MKVYQLEAYLCNYAPEIVRTFQVPANIKLSRLGYVLMTLFEMQASHMFSFDELKVVGDELEGGRHFALASMEEDDALDAASTALNSIVKNVGELIGFAYDYGDDWHVGVELQEIIDDPSLTAKDLPRVLSGQGYGIIEDCGGVPGLMDIAEAFKKKKGRQYKEYCEWLERDDLDLEAFDLDDMNFRLKKVPKIYADIYEKHQSPSASALKILTRAYKKS